MNRILHQRQSLRPFAALRDAFALPAITPPATKGRVIEWG